MRGRGHHRRLPDLPDRHRPGGDPARRHRDDRGDPRAQAALPGRADHPGPVQHLLRPEPGRPAWCSTRCSCTSASRPGWTRRSCTPPRSCRWRGSRTSSARSRSTWSTTARARRLRPAGSGSSSCSRASTRTSPRPTRAAELAALPLSERLERRIIDGERKGLEADLDEALDDAAGAGDRQRHAAGRHEDRRRAVRLRADAAAVRAAVGRGDEDRGRLPRAAHGEGRRRAARARIVLATVKGDVHDIGKNLVDIILSNNGYTSSTSASSSRSARSSTPPRSTTPTPSACPACW